MAFELGEGKAWHELIAEIVFQFVPSAIAILGAGAMGAGERVGSRKSVAKDVFPDAPKTLAA